MWLQIETDMIFASYRGHGVFEGTSAVQFEPPEHLDFAARHGGMQPECFVIDSWFMAMFHSPFVGFVALHLVIRMGLNFDPYHVL